VECGTVLKSSITENLWAVTVRYFFQFVVFERCVAVMAKLHQRREFQITMTAFFDRRDFRTNRLRPLSGHEKNRIFGYQERILDATKEG
jgi:hypothetical protein